MALNAYKKKGDLACLFALGGFEHLNDKVALSA